MKITMIVEDDHQQSIRIEPRASEKPGAFRLFIGEQVFDVWAAMAEVEDSARRYSHPRNNDTKMTLVLQFEEQLPLESFLQLPNLRAGQSDV